MSDGSTTITVDLDGGEALTAGTDGFDLAIPDGQGTDVTVHLASTLDTETVEEKTSELTLGDGTSTIGVLDEGDVTLETQVSSVTVQDGNGDTFTVDTDGESATLTVEVLNDDSDLTDNTYRVTGPDGNSVEVDLGGTDALQFDEDVVLKNGGTEVQIGSGNTFATETLGLVDAETAGTSGKVDNLELLVMRGAGAEDIDLSGTVISMTAPDGSHSLTYSSNAPEEDSKFTIEAVQDEDGTEPVLSSGDRFKIIIDPGTLDAGATATVKITTQAGATKVVQLRVPDSLANKEAVNL
ncbi:hypothetical protein [Halorussus salinisoli]|uniref:hypothetical protein n=1 Tax=Halorussus salinisoli TaxID=2558242 RepID=UPI003742215F